MHYSIHSTRVPIRDSMRSSPISSLKQTNNSTPLRRVVIHYVTKTEELLLPDDAYLYRKIDKRVKHSFVTYNSGTMHVFSEAFVKRIMLNNYFYLAMSFVFGKVHDNMARIAQEYEQERRRRKEWTKSLIISSHS